MFFKKIALYINIMVLALLPASFFCSDSQLRKKTPQENVVWYQGMIVATQEALKDYNSHPYRDLWSIRVHRRCLSFYHERLMYWEKIVNSGQVNRY